MARKALEREWSVDSAGASGSRDSRDLLVKKAALETCQRRVLEKSLRDEEKVCAAAGTKKCEYDTNFSDTEQKASETNLPGHVKVLQLDTSIT